MFEYIFITLCREALEEIRDWFKFDFHWWYRYTSARTVSIEKLNLTANQIIELMEMVWTHEIPGYLMYGL